MWEAVGILIFILDVGKWARHEILRWDICRHPYTFLVIPITFASRWLQKNTFIFDTLKRREQVLLTRLRIGHAGVNSYLHRFHIIPNQECSNCGFPNGDLEHYFLHCPTFDEERHELESGILQLGFNSFNLKILFSGIPNPHNHDITKLLMVFIQQIEMLQCIILYRYHLYN